MFDMTSPALKTNLPKHGQTWADMVFTTAAIYGANASGKTAVLQVLAYIRAAIAQSSREWLSNRAFVRDPFVLDQRFREGESWYSIDFLLDKNYSAVPPKLEVTRYGYEFSVSSNGVEDEILVAYYSSRPTTLFERRRSENSNKPHISFRVGGKFEVAGRELVLSRALVLGKELTVIASIAEELIRGIEIVGISDAERRSRINDITTKVFDGDFTRENLLTLTKIADIGISDVALDEKELPLEQVRMLQQLRKFLSSQQGDGGDEGIDTAESPSSATKENDERLETVFGRSLRFRHNSADSSDEALLRLGDESSGTLAWISLAVPILKALRSGSVLCVDEIDSSLHWDLARLAVSLFQDEYINPKGAQLIFTTHDPTLLFPQVGLEFDPAQIWITEKDNDGASTLYCVADFDVKLSKGSNIGKQLMEGKFGGAPYLAPYRIAELLLADEGTYDR